MASSLGAGKVITDGLIFYVDASNNKSYPGSGTVWTNLSQTEISSSLVNGPTFSSTTGGVIRFDGSNDYVDCTTLSQYFTTTSPKSWVFWTYLTQTSSVSSARILFNVFSTGYNGGRSIAFYNNGGQLQLTANLFLSVSNSSSIECNVSNVVNTWNHFGVVWNESRYFIYQNGVSLPTSFLTSIITPSSSLGSSPIRIGADPILFNPLFVGDIGQVSIYNRALSADEVLQNYESTRERFGLRGIAIDPDASLFLRTAGITDTTQQSAIDTLVLELKNAGIWSKMKAIYPFVGGTAATHKWNLKDPRDLDAAFRLTFSGGWTHSSTGADPNGTNAYANTNLIPNNVISSNLSMHISYYSRQNSTGVEVEIGSGDYVAPNDEQRRSFIEANTSGTSYWTVNGNNPSDFFSTSDTAAAAFYIASRTSSTVMAAFRNNSKSGTATKAAGNLSQNSIYIGAYNRPQFGSQQASYFSTKQTAFATIGDGLTDAEATNLYTIVQKYQTTLGRQV